MANGNYQPTQQMPRQGRHAQPQYQQMQYQQQYQQPQYQQYPPRQISFERESTSTGQWVLTLFLAAIPVLNIILMLVWAFGSSTEPSKKNWARANIIWAIIGVIFAIALIVAGTVLGVDWPQAFQEWQQRYFGM